MNLSLFDPPPPTRAELDAALAKLPPAPQRPGILAAGVDPIAHLEACAGCAECEVLERFFSTCPVCLRWSAGDSWPEPLRCLACAAWHGKPAPDHREFREAEERGIAALHRALLALARAAPAA